MNFSIFVHFHEILIFLLTLNKKYDIIIIENKERKMIMGKAKTTKIRLYSNEDHLNDTLDWLALTDEQRRLLDYLIVNCYLTDGINYEECDEPDFKTV